MGWLVNGESPFQETVAGPGLLTFEFSLVTCVVFGGVGGVRKPGKGVPARGNSKYKEVTKCLARLLVYLIMIVCLID